MISLRVLQHLEGGADQLLTEVHSGSFDKLQAVLVHDNPHPSLLKHSESKAEWMDAKVENLSINRSIS